MDRRNREATGEVSYGRFLYNRFRYYDPSVGRYISADPIGQGGGVNLFSYVGNRPMTFADPSGLVGPLVFGLTLGEAAVVAAGPVLAAAWCWVTNCGGAVADALDSAADAISTMCMGSEGEEGDDDPPPPPPGPHSDDRRALNDLINEATNSGNKPMSDADADTVVEWANELGIPDVMDHRGEDHWVGGDHIHVQGSGINHIPTGSR